jgi:hypothetical protein
MGAYGCIFVVDDDDDTCNCGEAEAEGRGLRSIEFVIISFDHRYAGCPPIKICHDEETLVQPSLPWAYFHHKGVFHQVAKYGHSPHSHSYQPPYSRA